VKRTTTTRLVLVIIIERNEFSSRIRTAKCVILVIVC